MFRPFPGAGPMFMPMRTRPVFHRAAIDLSETDIPPGAQERLLAAEEFACPICQEQIANPSVIIPCGHVLCDGCADAHAEHGGVDGQNATCPECRGPMNHLTDYHNFCYMFCPERLDPGVLERMSAEITQEGPHAARLGFGRHAGAAPGAGLTGEQTGLQLGPMPEGPPVVSAGGQYGLNPHWGQQFILICFVVPQGMQDLPMQMLTVDMREQGTGISPMFMVNSNSGHGPGSPGGGMTARPAFAGAGNPEAAATLFPTNPNLLHGSRPPGTPGRIFHIRPPFFTRGPRPGDFGLRRGEGGVEDGNAPAPRYDGSTYRGELPIPDIGDYRIRPMAPRRCGG